MKLTGKAWKFAQEDISTDLVGSFVDTLRQRDLDPLSLIMGGSSAGGSRRKSSSRLTQSEKAYIFTALIPSEQQTRLMELEELGRGEIIGAMLVTSRMVELGARQILPTIRQRRTSLSVDPVLPKSSFGRKETTLKSGIVGDRSSGRSSPKAARQPVLVIHARGMTMPQAGEAASSPIAPVTAEGSTSAFLDSTQDHLMMSVISDGGDLYSRRNSDVTPPSKKHKDPYAPVTPQVGPPGGGGGDDDDEPCQPATGVVEQYEILALSGRDIVVDGKKVNGKVITTTWDFLSLAEAQSHLNAGNTFFRFVSGGLAKLKRQDHEFVRLFVNISGFADEEKENYCPRVDPLDPAQQSKYSVILVKAMYILPGVLMSNITQELLASLDYNRNCQPGDVRFEEKDIPPRTFREVKTVVKFVYSLTIQMFVTEITDPEVLFSLKESDGMVPTKVLVLERTKRNPAKGDSTTKCKSVLMYYAVNGGVLVSHATIVLNTSVPTVVARILNTFGGQGCGECAQTAQLTRSYLIERFGDSRKQ